jgi:respiratory burst oxidase
LAAPTAAPRGDTSSSRRLASNPPSPRAQLDRTRSGAHKALRGLRFISTNKRSNAWMEVQANFDRLACDGFLARADFAECIGTATRRRLRLLPFVL